MYMYVPQVGGVCTCTSGWWYCVYMYLQVGGVGGVVCTFVHGMGCL